MFVFAKKCLNNVTNYLNATVKIDKVETLSLDMPGYKKMPNNSKPTWKCTNCKKSNAKPFHDSSAVPVSTGQEIPVSTTTCSFQSHDSEPEVIELDMYNAQESVLSRNLSATPVSASTGNCSLKQVWFSP